MERNDFLLITRTISQTISFINRSQNLSKDDIDDIKNQTLLKLTPQLKKILNFEPLHLQNFIRKTTKSVFWDYLKSRSRDLTNYRIKKRIKDILINIDNLNTPFKKIDNDTSWYINDKDINREMPDAEKRIELEQVINNWKRNLPSDGKSATSDVYLTDLMERIFSEINFGVSVNDIFFSMAGIIDIEEIIFTSLETGASNESINGFNVLPADEIPADNIKIDNSIYYENYAEEFLKKYTTNEQIRVYYLRFVMNLGYKEIEKKFHINIKTAESRLSIKPDKKGFLWRLVQFIKDLELSIDESKEFLFILDRKIGDLYGICK
jgi:hypothetical protein